MENEEKRENSAIDVFNFYAKQTKVMWAAIFVLICLLVASNMVWLYVFQSYDYVSQDGEGYNYYNSRVEGSVYNGADGENQEERQVEGN